MSTPEWVRVRLPETGMEVSLSRAFVDGLPESVERLDVTATNSRGLPLAASRKNGRRVKPRTTVSTEAAKKAASSTATVNSPVDVVDTSEEDSK